MSIADHPNVQAVHDKEEDDSGELDTTSQTIYDKIVHVLTIYPKVSPSMLQVGLGTALMPALWKPILQDMIKNGVVQEERDAHSTPSGRQQVYTILSLAHKIV